MEICLFQYHEDPTFLEHQQAGCCSPSFSASKIHFCWISRAQRNHYLRCVVWDNTKPMKVHQGQKTEAAQAAQTVWFCLMITHVHACPGSHMWSGPSLTGSNLTHLPYSPHMLPCDFHAFSPLKKTPERAALQLIQWTQGHFQGLGLVIQPQKFREHGILWVVNEWDHCA